MKISQATQLSNNILTKLGFRKEEAKLITQNLLHRKEGQEYKDLVENLMPNIFIEDNCESIGGEVEMTYPHIKQLLKPEIYSIVTKEFAGIDNLPDDFSKLKNV